ncbi:MAG TPA: hypothetical protein VMQ86_07450 [Bryobacteraceae bacterium]|jgi:hypothetical protein|nr:hypothetical protein [Bryobacteraceae bacterium]
MIEIRDYIDEGGNKRFANGLKGSTRRQPPKVTIALARMEQGNLSKVKSVGVRRLRVQDRFRPRLSNLLRQGWRQPRDFDWGAARRYSNNRTPRRRMDAGPHTNEERNRRFNEMPLTHDFKETIRARAQRDPDFRQALLRDAVELALYLAKSCNA